jgi:hypothetical protein
MSNQVLDFFNTHYAKGRIGMIGGSDIRGWIVRNGQRGLTPDMEASRWSHVFIFGDKREDGRADGSVYIFESDLHVDIDAWQVINGVQESRLMKWCKDYVENACVLGINLTPEEQKAVTTKALELAYGEERFKYPLGELFGTLIAIIFRRMDKKNIFDERFSVHCSTYVRMCYQHIGKEILTGPVELANTSPEAIWQSQAFTFREEWHR